MSLHGVPPERRRREGSLVAQRPDPDVGRAFSLVTFSLRVCIDRRHGGHMCGDMVDGLCIGGRLAQVDLHQLVVDEEHIEQSIGRGARADRHGLATKWVG